MRAITWVEGMEPPSGLGRKAIAFVGFLVGSSLGAVGFWGIGYVAFHSSSASVVVDVLAFVAILAFVASLISPLALVLFFRSRFRGRVRQDLVTIGGYVVAFLFVAAIGFLGVFVLSDLGIDTALEGIAFLDAVFGWTFGGILGAILASRLVRRGEEP